MLAFDALLNAVEKPEDKKILEFRAKGTKPPRVHQAWRSIGDSYELVNETSFL